jgi:hypothetical protein
MSAHIFDTPSSHCPICQRAGAAKPHKLISGFLTCQHCRERLVVSWSGHYVRDPFTSPPTFEGTEQMLRRESRPIARIRRDLRLLKPLMLGTLGGAVVFGIASIVLQNPSLRQYLPFQSAPPMQVEKPTPPPPSAS